MEPACKDLLSALVAEDYPSVRSELLRSRWWCEPEAVELLRPFVGPRQLALLEACQQEGVERALDSLLGTWHGIAVPAEFWDDVAELKQLESHNGQTPHATDYLIHLSAVALDKLNAQTPSLLHGWLLLAQSRGYGDLEEAEFLRFFERAQKLAQRARADGEALGEAHLTAEALITLGDLEQRRARLATGQEQAAARSLAVGRAIDCYEQARNHIEQNSSTAADLRYHMGDSYSLVDLKRAIAEYEQALLCFPSAPRSFDCARTCMAIADCYLELSEKDGTDSSLRKSIENYDRALLALDLRISPRLCASLHTRQGLAFSNLAAGPRHKNLEHAVACFQKAVDCQDPSWSVWDRLHLQTHLASAYLELPPALASDRPLALAAEIERTLRQADSNKERDRFLAPLVWLGGYYRAVETGVRAQNLNSSARCLQEALALLGAPEKDSHLWARLHFELGLTWKDFSASDRELHEQKCLACWQEALKFWTAETAPTLFAMVNCTLGNLLVYAVSGDSFENWDRARHCLERSLSHTSPTLAPDTHAGALTGLGLLALEETRGDAVLRGRQAVDCFKQALRIWTRESAPAQHGKTLCNLAIAYGELATFDFVESLAFSITCLEKALSIFEPDRWPLAHARVQHSLASAYLRLSEDKHEKELHQALAAQQEALRYFNRESNPAEYAAAMHNLGHILAALDRTDVAAAVRCYEEVLALRSATGAPEDAAAVLHSLGRLYARLDPNVRSDSRTQAISYLLRALQGFSLPAHLHHQHSVLMELGELYHNAGDLQEASKFFRHACNTDEQIYRTSLSKRNKVLTIASHPGPYAKAAYVAVRLGQMMPALSLLEQGKSRILLESFRLSEPERHPDAAGPAPGLDQDAIERALPDDATALVSLCTTEHGGLAFLYSRRHGLQTVDLPACTPDSLSKLLVEREPAGLPVAGWLVAYQRHNQDEHNQQLFDDWLHTIDHTLSVLEELPLFARIPQGIKRLVLSVSGPLVALPLHALRVSPGAELRLGDVYEINYVPSFAAWQHCISHAAAPAETTANGVVIQDDSLLFSRFECQAIAGSLASPPTLITASSDVKEQVVTALSTHSFVHFSCHAFFSPRSPLSSAVGLPGGGSLTLDELLHKPWSGPRARLVVLAACESSMSSTATGLAAEQVGLPAGFLSMGIPCVIGSLWAVPTLSTALLMRTFYEQCQRGTHSIAKALQLAQRKVANLTAGEVLRYAEACCAAPEDRDNERLREYRRYYASLAQRDPQATPFGHPYYWAAFVVNGT